jgi:hypothetical protein
MRSFDEGYLRFSDSLPGQRCSQLLRSAFQMDICSARRLVDLELFKSRLLSLSKHVDRLPLLTKFILIVCC